MGKGMKAGKRKVPQPGMKKGGGGMQQQQLMQIQAMQARMEEVQAEIEQKEVETTAGGGAVAVKVNGKKELLGITKDPEVMDPQDSEMLQDLIVVAVNEAFRQVDEISAAEMEKVTGGMNLPF